MCSGRWKVSPSSARPPPPPRPAGIGGGGGACAMPRPSFRSDKQSMSLKVKGSHDSCNCCSLLGCSAIATKGVLGRMTKESCRSEHTPVSASLSTKGLY